MDFYSKLIIECFLVELEVLDFFSIVISLCIVVSEF